MTPGARVQAAITALDAVLRGASAERTLTAWARASRYAGSGDRAAVRDHVFDALRRLRSAAWAGGLGDVPPEAMDARAVMAGLLAGQGADLAALFTGQGHAPAPLAPWPDPGPAPAGVDLDCPDWLLPPMRASLGARADTVLAALRDRAPVTLRVNLARSTREALGAMLCDAGIHVLPHPASSSALTVEGPARGLTGLPAFTAGLFEMQDAGSQALVDRLPPLAGIRVLDLCAGGGGKMLAMAARGADKLFAHDVDPNRMRDLDVRAARAGVAVTRLADPASAGAFDAVVADVPCSGSGSWRRAPEAKWRLTPDRLSALVAMQSEILDRAAALTRRGGWIAYMTCSLLEAENGAAVDAALRRHSDLSPDAVWRTTPGEGTDGFFLAVLSKA